MIAGNLATSTASGDDINVFNNGISSSQITISGNVTTHKGGDVAVYSDGKLELSGIVMSDDDVSLTALGSSVVLKGPITADVGEDNGFFTLAAPVAHTHALPRGPGHVAAGHAWF